MKDRPPRRFPNLAKVAYFNNNKHQTDCCGSSAISGFCGRRGGKQFNISESKFLCCKSKITIYTLHKLKWLWKVYETMYIGVLWKLYLNSVTNQSLENSCSVKILQFSLFQKSSIQSMAWILAWESHEFSVSGYELGSVKRLWKEIMRGLGCTVYKIIMLEKIHFWWLILQRLCSVTGSGLLRLTGFSI